MEGIKKKIELARECIRKSMENDRFGEYEYNLVKEILDRTEPIVSMGEMIGGMFQIDSIDGVTLTELHELAESFKKVPFDKKYKFNEDRKDSQIKKIYCLKRLDFEKENDFFILSDENYFWKSKTPF